MKSLMHGTGSPKVSTLTLLTFLGYIVMAHLHMVVFLGGQGFVLGGQSKNTVKFVLKPPRQFNDIC